jgi:hypothetical protein
MLKLIAILTSCSLALAFSVQAKEHSDQNTAKAQSQKPKNAQKQQFAPKQQQQLKTPKTHVEKLQRPRTDSPRVTKEKIQTTKSHEQLQKTRLSKETVAKIQSQHLNFQAKPSTTIASVKFNQDYRIQAAQNWNGAQYEVFRSYQPQWHDQTWYRSRYSNNLSLIAGGWYFWDAGYWYPAWGYDSSAAYYPYDGPIYSGPSARPFDQVVADVQAALQEQGYYKGEVDGLIGPLTRQALAEYQQANGLYATETIDQPTLSSLGLAG